MFNWLKNKQNLLLPNDASKGFMTSNFCTIKLGTKLTVPYNFVCFVSFHDKIYLELQEGTHVLDETNLSALYKKQAGKLKIHKLKVDLFFVNLSAFNRTFKFSDKIPVNKENTKFNFNVSIQMKVENAKLFTDFILSELSFVNPAKADVVIEDYTIEFLQKFFLKISFEDLYIPTQVKTELFEKLKIFYAKLGIGLQTFSIEATANNAIIPVRENFFESSTKVKVENSKNSVDEVKEIKYTTSNQEVCPNCCNKLIKNSLYCHRCGYKTK